VTNGRVTAPASATPVDATSKTGSATGLSGLAAAAGISAPTSGNGEKVEKEAGVAPLVPANGTPTTADGKKLPDQTGADEAPTTPGGTVMKDTIGDIDKAINSLGTVATPSRTAPAADEADDESIATGRGGVHPAESDSDEELADPIWGAVWGGDKGKSARSRLAEQARAENERKEREDRERSGLALQTGDKSTGVPTGLIYSDESESDEEEAARKTGVDAIRSQIASASASPTVPQQPTVEKPAEEQHSVGGAIAAAATTAAVGVGAAVASGAHAVAEAVGLESSSVNGPEAVSLGTGSPAIDPSSVALPDTAPGTAAPTPPVELTSTPPPAAIGSGQTARRVSEISGRMESPLGTKPSTTPTSDVPPPQSANGAGLLPAHSITPVTQTPVSPQFATAPPQTASTKSAAATPASGNGFGGGTAPVSTAPSTLDDKSGRAWSSVPGTPSEWTVEQVMVWARSKGFDETVVTKFQGKRW
jgi:hypothetical protein